MRTPKIVLLLLAASPSVAFAYLDPGTGSMLLQVILGGIAAVGVALKLFWYRIIAFFGIKKSPAASDDGDDDDDI
ncbi:MAG: hypothetical protein ACI9H8_001962 [Lysobacterales bacterium]|jgi:hypothetical protein